jgi:hypothetical protein
MIVRMNKKSFDLNIVDISAQKSRREIGKNCSGGGGNSSSGSD